MGRHWILRKRLVHELSRLLLLLVHPDYSGSPVHLQLRLLFFDIPSLVCCAATTALRLVCTHEATHLHIETHLILLGFLVFIVLNTVHASDSSLLLPVV